jgi:hypothetical protein
VAVLELGRAQRRFNTATLGIVPARGADRACLTRLMGSSCFSDETHRPFAGPAKRDAVGRGSPRRHGARRDRSDPLGRTGRDGARQVPVELRNEKVFVEREAFDQPRSRDEIRDDEAEMTVSAEEPVVEKKGL